MSVVVASEANRLGGAMLVLAGAAFWSTAGLAIRLMDGATAWQILFYRSSALSLFLLAVLAARHRGRLARAFRAVGWAGVLGAVCIVLAFMSNILAMTMTTIANAAFLQATQAFFGAALGWLVLGEPVGSRTWLAMAAALAGVALMMGDGLAAGTVVGNLFGLACGFWSAAFGVSLRFCRAADNLPIVCLAGVFAAIATAALAGELRVSDHDMSLAFAMGIFQIGLGMILFAMGARRMPTAELMLLALLELVLAPVWVWLVVGEIPSALTLAGGALVVGAVVAQVLAGGRGAASALPTAPKPGPLTPSA